MALPNYRLVSTTVQYLWPRSFLLIVSKGQKSQQQHQEHQAIIDWLSPLRFGAKQKDYYSRAQQGTGKWLSEADAFNQWLNSTTGVLWCPGNRTYDNGYSHISYTDTP